jgi:hypothetical protein
MCSSKLKHSQYAHQRVVATFGDLIQYYKDRGIIHISRTLAYSAIIEGVCNKVHWFINTGALSYEEWSKEQPWPDEE